MTHPIRRILFGTVAASTAVVLVACGGGSSNDASEGSEETTTSKVPNEPVTSPPAFSTPTDRIAEIENEGCGPMMEEWGDQMAIWISTANQGTWETVQTEFSPTTVAENQNACEIKVTDSGIAGTVGGDLNNYTVTITGLSAENNPIDARAIDEMWQLSQGEEKTPEISPDQLANVSPLMESAYAFATAHGDPDFNGAYRSQEMSAEGFFQVGDTQVATYTEATYTPNAEAEPKRGTWAAVTTDEPQKDTVRKSGSAAGQVAQMFTWQMYGKAGMQDSWFEIQDNPIN